MYSVEHTSWLLLRECAFTLSSFMYKSISYNLRSRIIQSLFIQQIKLSKSILALSGKCDLTGQGIIARSIIETEADIAWLLLSNDDNKFGNYIAHGLRASNDTIKDMNRDEKIYGCKLPIQTRLKEESYYEYRMAGLSDSQIKHFLNLSHTQMNKKYPHINARQKIHILNPAKSSYLTYSVLSNETHSNFAEAVNRNTYRYNRKFIGNVDSSKSGSDPRMMDPISLGLINSFHLIRILGYFTFPSNTYEKKIIGRLGKLRNNILYVERYHEKLLQSDI